MICQIDDLDIYYETRGEGAPLLAIHGYYLDHRVMTACLEPIFSRREGWKRIYLDLPGMGRSRAPSWLNNADQMLDILVKFCDTVLPDEQFLLAGESYGGYLARGLVRSLPERLSGVLLICPVIIADRTRRDLPPRKVFAKDESYLASIAPSELNDWLERALAVQDKQRWERFTRDAVGMNVKDDAFIKRFETSPGYSFSFDVDELLHPFDRPALILVGRQDAFVGYRDSLKLNANYSRATFAVLDRAGHGLEVEQETLFSCLVDELFDRVEQAQHF